MAEAKPEDTFVPFEQIETWRQGNICFFCRNKSFQDKLKCEKCLEFEYCSIDCLEIDRAAHERQCNVISVRKGLRHWIPKSFLNFIINRAKLLDFTCEIKDENEARRELEAIKRLKSTLGKNMSDPIKNRKGKNRRKKRKKKKVQDADDKYIPKRQQRVPLPFYDLVSGKFGRPITCGRRELSGQEFGRGWWKSEVKTEPPLMHSAPSSKVVMTTIKVTDQDYARMTSADLYPDTDEETYGEVNGNPQEQSTKSRGLPDKTKDQFSRENKKPTAQNNGTEPRATKPKPPKSKTVKAEVDKTTREDGEQCRNQTVDDLGTSVCCFCGKRSNALKTCMGCKNSRYCDKVCQSKDYKTHKIQCKRDQRFQNAVKMANMCITGESLNQSALTFEQKGVGRAHQWLLLEIVESHFFMFCFGVMSVDLTGRNIFLTVIVPPDTLFEKVNRQTGAVTMVTLDTCLRPGNFILVFKPNCVAFINGTPTIEINELEKFSFVLNSRSPTSS